MGRPKKLSVLDKILALAEKPEVGVPPPDVYGRRRLSEGRSMPRRREGTREAWARRKARADARPREPRKGQKLYFPDGKGEGMLRGTRSIIGTRHIDRLLWAMQPGAWHSSRDLARATGTSTSRLAEMTERGLVVRGLSTRWGMTRPRDTLTERAYTTRWNVPEAKWVYRLSPLGEGVRRFLVVLGYEGA